MSGRDGLNFCELSILALQVTSTKIFTFGFLIGRRLKIMSTLDLSLSGALTRTGTSHTSYNPDVREYQRRNSELQRAVTDLKLQLVNRENQFSKALIDGHVDEQTVRQLLTATRNTEDRDAEIRHLKAELADANQKLDRVRLKKRQLKERGLEMQDEITSLNNKISTLRASEVTSPSSSKQFTQLKLEHSRLQQLCATKDAQNAELTVENVTLRSKLRDYENNEAHSESEVARLRAQLSDLTDELAKARTTINDLTDRVYEAENKVRTQTNAQEEDQLHVRKLAHSARSRVSHIHDEMEKLSQSVIKSTQTLSEQIDGVSERLPEFRKAGETAVEKLAALCARFAGISVENVPNAEDLCNDPATLDFFLGRASTSFEMQAAEENAGARKSAVVSKVSKSGISPEVTLAVRNIQGRVEELKKTLHNDHTQLVDILTTGETN